MPSGRQGAAYIGRVSRPALSVVIPAYEEASRIGTTLHALCAATAEQHVEVIVVDDGSSDDTAAIATANLEGHRGGSVLRLGSNRGKGAAVKAGVLTSTGDVVLYMDADLATDLTALPVFLAALADADVVSGSRTLPDAVVRNGTRDRAAMAWVFNHLVRTLTGIDSHDTQCGFKMFRGDAARRIFALAKCERFAFDVEVLVLARRLGLRVVERPVVWTAVEGSSVRRGIDSLRAGADVVRIAARWTPRRVARASESMQVRAPAREG
jgi:glycosyltransferase involved in cell wall biosynthesis